jgi:hypothetical protein
MKKLTKKQRIEIYEKAIEDIWCCRFKGICASLFYNDKIDMYERRRVRGFHTSKYNFMAEDLPELKICSPDLKPEYDGYWYNDATPEQQRVDRIILLTLMIQLCSEAKQ